MRCSMRRSTDASRVWMRLTRETWRCAGAWKNSCACAARRTHFSRRHSKRCRAVARQRWRWKSRAISSGLIGWWKSSARVVEGGDALLGLLHFAAAWRLDEGDASREEPHRRQAARDLRLTDPLGIAQASHALRATPAAERAAASHRSVSRACGCRRHCSSSPGSNDVFFQK